MKIQTRFAVLNVMVAVCLAAVTAHADDVTDQVAEALEAYKNKDYPMAAQGLEMAAQLIRQKRGENLGMLLPAALKGWQADEPQSQAAGSMYYGGVAASRTYRKGDATVTVQFITDSPMLQGYLMMINTPMIAGASGAKLERLKGQRALVNAADLTLNVVVGGALLVTIDGDECDLADVRAYAEAVDYAALADSL